MPITDLIISNTEDYVTLTFLKTYKNNLRNSRKHINNLIKRILCFTGEKGVTGIQGDSGEPGVNGLPGPQGPPGANVSLGTYFHV